MYNVSVTRVEKENMILETFEGSIVYTMQKSWWTHFEKKGLKPSITHRSSSGNIIAYTYHLPDNWIVRKPTPKRKVSDKQRKEMAKRMKEYHRKNR